jgi:cellulose synthase/poly-beta-1,6-N-acetylglucosamine synthase-like glycosyltransferase
MMHELYSVVEYAVVSILAVPASLACLYLLVLTCLSVRNTEPPSSSRRLTFDVIVPAHDEAASIAGTVSNLQQLDWPTERFRVVVVADNCTDTTAEIARASGATVITRRDATRRG